MPDPTRHHQLDQLHQAEAQERHAARELDAQLTTARAKAAELHDEWVQATADRATAKITQAKTRHAAADAEISELEVKVKAAKLRIDRATAAAAAYQAEHANELVKELSAEASAITNRLVEAATVLVQADKDWYTMSARVGAHLAAKGVEPRGNLPNTHGYENVIRDVRRTLTDVGEPRPPLPHYQAAQWSEQQEAAAVEAKAQRDADRDRQERQRQAQGPAEVITNQ